MHRMTWYIGTCSIMVISLLYILDSMGKCVQMCYMELGFNGCFLIGATMKVKSL
jgi:hypothetical protein